MAKKKAVKAAVEKPEEPELPVDVSDDLPAVDPDCETASDVPPVDAAIDPDVAARDARMHTLLQTLARHGMVISQQQFLLQSDETIAMTNRWVDAVLADPDRDPPALPPSLLAFATRELRERIAPAPEKSLPPRKYLGCTFGNVSVGDQTASIPVKVDADRFRPEEAHEFLCGRRVEAVIVLEENSERDQERIEDYGPPRVATICDIKSYRGAVNDWGFKLTFQKQEIEVASLGQFAHRTGRLELQLLGDSDDEDSDRPHGEQPHPDVEMGKDRPHGTPAVEALAEAAGPTLFDMVNKNRNIHDVPVTPRNSTPLKLGLQQLSASLKLARVSKLPLNDLFFTWVDETREAVDTWAKTVLAHAAGDKSQALLEIPDEIREYLPAEQISHPVGYVKAGGKSPLTWQCLNCGNNWASTKPRVCSSCEAKGDHVVLVGFYGEPAVDFGGCFVGDDVEEFQVLPDTSTSYLYVRLVQGDDQRWRAALLLEFAPETGEPESVNDWPTIRDPGVVDANQAIAAVIGRLIDRWQPLSGDRRESAVAVLKEYLARIEAGEEPLALEQAIPAAQNAEHW